MSFHVFLINIYLLCLVFQSLCILFPYLYFSFLLLDFHSHTWSQHFLTFLGLYHPHTVSLHLPQWNSGNYYGPPLASCQKNNFQTLFLSRWAQQSQPWPSCITLFWVNRRGWRWWGGVSLISWASTFYSLRQSWLSLFGCQYKSRGSRAIVSSRERTEQIGFAEGREWGNSCATQQIADCLTWELHRQGSAPKCHSTQMKTIFVIALTEVEHCWLANGQHSVFVCQETMVQL